jgi:hypothetical protein
MKPLREIHQPKCETKILSTKRQAWMQAPIEVFTESSGEVFLLDILSHRMSANAVIRRAAALQ